MFLGCLEPLHYKGQVKSLWQIKYKWARPWENVSYAICKQKDADQPAHPRSLISPFVVRCLDSMIALDSIGNSKTLAASLCGCAGRFVSGLVGNSRRHVLSCRGSNIILSSFRCFNVSVQYRRSLRCLHTQTICGPGGSFKQSATSSGTDKEGIWW